MIMATHNDENFLSYAIKSVLAQTYKNLELIIIDDAADVKTREILMSFRDPRIKILENETNLGLTRSLNNAIKIAQGEFIGRMDADDIAESTRFKIQVDFLKNNPDVMALGSWAKIIGDDGKEKYIKKKPVSYQKIKKSIARFNPFIHSSLVFRSKVFKEIGIYDEEFVFAQDYDLMLRIANEYKVINIPSPLITYRDHQKSISNSQMQRQLWLAQKARIKAIREGNLKKTDVIFLVKPFVSLLIPPFVKKFILKFLI